LAVDNNTLQQQMSSDVDKSNEGSVSNKPDALSEWTLLQQQIICARIADFDAGLPDLSDQVDSSYEYVRRTVSDAEDLINGLKTRRRNGESVEQIIATEASSALREGGYLAEIDVDTSKVRAATNADPRDEADDATCGGEESTATDDADDTVHEWGDPTVNHGVMTANPDHSTVTESARTTDADGDASAPATAADHSNQQQLPSDTSPDSESDGTPESGPESETDDVASDADETAANADAPDADESNPAPTGTADIAADKTAATGDENPRPAETDSVDAQIAALRQGLDLFSGSLEAAMSVEHEDPEGMLELVLAVLNQYEKELARLANEVE
jgi:hypothetical protein